jgi:uncharacterized protein (TIGR02246 family)
MAINRLVAALNDNDIDALVALYEEDATLVIYPGMVGHGTPAVRRFFERVFTLKPRVKYESLVFTNAGDLVLFTAKWVILSDVPPHLPVPRTDYHVHAAILRKHPDGDWLISVDNPWGPELPPEGEAA